jgi:hypothetical protein
MCDAYDAEQWAIFPTLDCMGWYITELEKLHQEELGGTERVTSKDVERKIREVEESGKAGGEFALLARKGCELPGIPPSLLVHLPISPEIVWSFETERYRSIADSLGSQTENSDFILKVRCSPRLGRPHHIKHTDASREQATSSRRPDGWTFWRMSRTIRIGNPGRLCDHSSCNPSCSHFKSRRPGDKINNTRASFARPGERFVRIPRSSYLRVMVQVSR